MRFTIVAPLASILALAYAAGNAFSAPLNDTVWYVGSTETISWVDDSGSSITLDLMEGSSNDLSVAANIGTTENQGSVSWSIPDFISSGTYALRITNSDDANDVNYSPWFKIVNNGTASATSEAANSSTAAVETTSALNASSVEVTTTSGVPTGNATTNGTSAVATSNSTNTSNSTATGNSTETGIGGSSATATGSGSNTGAASGSGSHSGASGSGAHTATATEGSSSSGSGSGGASSNAGAAAVAGFAGLIGAAAALL